MGVKVKKAKEFLSEGHMVKITAVYRGRELAHKEIGYKLLEKVVDMIGELGTTDSNPIFAGKQLTQLVRSKTHAKN